MVANAVQSFLEIDKEEEVGPFVLNGMLEYLNHIAFDYLC